MAGVNPRLGIILPSEVDIPQIPSNSIALGEKCEIIKKLEDGSVIRSTDAVYEIIDTILTELQLKSGIKLVRHIYRHVAVEGQTDFEIPLSTFDNNLDLLIPILNLVSLTGLEGDAYTVTDGLFKLTEPCNADDEVVFLILKNVPVGEDSVFSGKIIAEKSMEPNRIIENAQKRFTSDGEMQSKDDRIAQLELAIANIDLTPVVEGRTKLIHGVYKHIAVEGQTDFEIPVVAFDKTTDVLIPVINLTSLIGLENDAYTIEANLIKFSTPCVAGDVVVLFVLKDVPSDIGAEISGKLIAEGTLSPSSILETVEKRFTSDAEMFEMDGKILSLENNVLYLNNSLQAISLLQNEVASLNTAITLKDDKIIALESKVVDLNSALIKQKSNNLSLIMELQTSLNANLSGISKNIVIESLDSLDDINMIHGNFDNINGRIYI